MLKALGMLKELCYNYVRDATIMDGHSGRVMYAVSALIPTALDMAEAQAHMHWADRQTEVRIQIEGLS